MDFVFNRVPPGLRALLKKSTGRKRERSEMQCANPIVETTLARMIVENHHFSRRITSSILKSCFRSKAHELVHPSSYNPDFTFDPGLHVKKAYPTVEVGYERRGGELRGSGSLTPSKSPYRESSPRASRASSSCRPTIPPNLEANPRLLFTYPPTGVDAVSINSNDVLRLADGCYLNDSIIDLDLRRLYLHAEACVRRQVHIFSSFLYRKLTKEGTACSTIPVNIFERTFSFIPINEHLHWYLALICNPMHAMAVSSLSAATDQGVDGRNDSLPPSVSDSSSLPGSQAPVEPSGTYVVIFDSLGSRHRRAAVEKIKAFICSEARFKMAAEVDKKQIGVLYPKLPLQKNLTDCGWFLLEYVDRFLQHPQQVMASIMEKRDLSRWFSHDDTGLRRVALKTFIESNTRHGESYAFADTSLEASRQPSASSDVEEIYPHELDLS